MTWDVAKSLDVLLWQINTMAPNRSKRSDGSIGDTSPQHQTPDSQHFPEDKPGSEPDEVDARDFTNDPAAGADMDEIADDIRRSRDDRVLYVIWRNLMFSSYPKGPYAAWDWRPYTGDYHTHLHVSVNDRDDDNQRLWRIGPWAALGRDDGGDPMLKVMLISLAGRASVMVKEPDRPLRWLNHAWAVDALAAAGAVRVPPAPSAKAIVDTFGPLEGRDPSQSRVAIEAAG